MRLIDADALFLPDENSDKVLILGGRCGSGKTVALATELLKKKVEDAPTIEPESLRPKGEWIDKVEFNNGERVIATCSNCKDRGELRTDRNEWGLWHINSPHCPNCGADMRKESHNGC